MESAALSKALGEETGWREPHFVQKVSVSRTWFPQWLQNGILLPSQQEYVIIA
ncbi:MAG: hypothetical protein U5J83_14060 [Bryobacterales bacterium]|nr:hypothetical protein [Bryobacterales bacterium]